jgi:hypothetical protein
LELTIVLGAMALVGAGLAVRYARSLPPTRSRWQGLAEACGLTEIRSLHRFSHALAGRFGALDVLFEEYGRSKARAGNATRVTVRGIAPFIAFRPESLGTRIERALGANEIQIGDDAFDRSLYVEGSEKVLRALLDAETRTLLRDAFAGRIVPSAGRAVEIVLYLRGGEMQVEFGDDVAAGGEPLSQTLRSLLALAERLQDPPDLLARLAENAQRDPLPSVRRLILSTLARAAAEEPVTRAAMEQAARGDPDGGVRLLAALWLDRDGRPTLEALGHVGSAASVLPLKEAAQGTRGRLVNVALEAIAQIRSRLTGADPGQLSLAAGSDGQLALTDDEKGRVTLPEPPDPP